MVVEVPSKLDFDVLTAAVQALADRLTALEDKVALIEAPTVPTNVKDAMLVIAQYIQSQNT